jgi:hypothetical protein
VVTATTFGGAWHATRAVRDATASVHSAGVLASRMRAAIEEGARVICLGG